MFGFLQGENGRLTEALARHHAVIEFTPDGTILAANENFLTATGYRLDEIKGRHHRIFMPAEDRDSAEYASFWTELARGRFKSAQCRRVTKSGKDLWIRASYTPVTDETGQVVRVVKHAVDITEEASENAMAAARLLAADRCFAVIEFTPEGEILQANANFLAASEYAAEEIVGRHHRIFCDADYARSEDYRAFWRRLAAGEFFTGEYKRVRKSGAPLWIRAIYSPMTDHEGKVVRVVKYAVDITEEVQGRERREAAQGDLNTRLETIAASIAEASDKAARASAASEGVTNNVQAVATGAEQLDASIREISGQVETARGVSLEASENTAKTREVVDGLASAAQKIGEVVELISSIADQTNLLALNATIEAARAGEAGKGFAVVASEVKTLASQTAKATGEIGEQISAMQSASAGAVSAMADVADVINRVNDISSSIAAAVTEQSQVTGSISRNLQEAAASVSQLDGDLKTAAERAQESEAGARDAAEAARKLA
jgi:methyl-accepting chemotaxis protein